MNNQLINLKKEIYQIISDWHRQALSEPHSIETIDIHPIQYYGLCFLFFYKIYTPKELGLLLSKTSPEISDAFHRFLEMPVKSSLHYKQMGLQGQGPAQRPMVLNHTPIELCLFDILCITHPTLIVSLIRKPSFLDFLLKTSRLKKTLNELFNELTATSERQILPHSLSYLLLTRYRWIFDVMPLDWILTIQISESIEYIKCWELLVLRKPRSLEIFFFNSVITTQWLFVKLSTQLDLQDKDLQKNLLISALKNQNLTNFKNLLSHWIKTDRLIYLRYYDSFHRWSFFDRAIQYGRLREFFEIVEPFYRSIYPNHISTWHLQKFIEDLNSGSMRLPEKIMHFTSYQSLIDILYFLEQEFELEWHEFFPAHSHVPLYRVTEALFQKDPLNPTHALFSFQSDLEKRSLRNLSHHILTLSNDLNCTNLHEAITSFTLRFIRHNQQKYCPTSVMAFEKIFEIVLQDLLITMRNQIRIDHEYLISFITAVIIFKHCPFQHHHYFRYFNMIKEFSVAFLDHIDANSSDPIIDLYQKTFEWLQTSEPFQNYWLIAEQDPECSIFAFFMHQMSQAQHSPSIEIVLHRRIHFYCQKMRDQLMNHKMIMREPTRESHPIEENWATHLITKIITDFKGELSFYWAELLQICTGHWTMSSWSQWKNIYLIISSVHPVIDKMRVSPLIDQIFTKSVVLIKEFRLFKEMSLFHDPLFNISMREDVSHAASPSTAIQYSELTVDDDNAGNSIPEIPIDDHEEEDLLSQYGQFLFRNHSYGSLLDQLDEQKSNIDGDIRP